MRDKLILVIKGFFFGIANIIPGVSGGTIALTMGVYEDLIEVISHFFRDLKRSFSFSDILIGNVEIQNKN